MPPVDPKFLTAIKFLLLYLLLIISFNGFSQNEHNTAIRRFDKQSTNFLSAVYYQTTNSIVLNSVQKIDSIAETNSMARYFAKEYGESMKKVAFQMEEFDSAAKVFIRIFENSFADYFLNACYANETKQLSGESEWKFFFSHPDLRPWQLVILGVNAHTNIDIWKSLVNNFSEKEIRHYKKQILVCQRSIAKVYSDFFNEVLREKSYLRFINSFTRGFAKITGER